MPRRRAGVQRAARTSRGRRPGAPGRRRRRRGPAAPTRRPGGRGGAAAARRPRLVSRGGNDDDDKDARIAGLGSRKRSRRRSRRRPPAAASVTGRSEACVAPRPAARRRSSSEPKYELGLPSRRGPPSPYKALFCPDRIETRTVEGPRGAWDSFPLLAIESNRPQALRGDGKRTRRRKLEGRTTRSPGRATPATAPPWRRPRPEDRAPPRTARREAANGVPTPRRQEPASADAWPPLPGRGGGRGAPGRGRRRAATTVLRAAAGPGRRSGTPPPGRRRRAAVAGGATDDGRRCRPGYQLGTPAVRAAPPPPAATRALLARTEPVAPRPPAPPAMT